MSSVDKLRKTVADAPPYKTSKLGSSIANAILTDAVIQKDEWAARNAANADALAVGYKYPNPNNLRNLFESNTPKTPTGGKKTRRQRKERKQRKTRSQRQNRKQSKKNYK